MSAMITIGATELPNPSVYNVSIQTIVGENTKRSTEGDLIADKKAEKFTIELGWKYLTSAQYSTILNLFSDFFFSVTFHNPVTASTSTKTFYVGDRKCGVFKYDVGTNSITGWSDVTFTLVQQ